MACERTTVAERNSIVPMGTRAFLLASTTFVLLGCQRGPAADIATADVVMDPAPFDSVAIVGADAATLALPPYETVASYSPSSPVYQSTELAAAADGTVAIADPWSCTIVLLDGDTGERERRIDACGETGRRVDDLFWVARDLLGVFDMSSRELRLFRRDGAGAGRVPIAMSPQGGMVTAAFPLADGASVLAAVGFLSAAGHERLVQWLDSDGALKGAFLAGPAVARRSGLRFPFGVEVCVQQSPGASPPSFLAVNGWAHDVFMGAPDDSVAVWRSIVPREGYMFRDDDGLLMPLPGRVAVACGEDAGLAHRTFLRTQSGKETTAEGTLDWLSFSGELIARFDLASAPVFAQSREIGLDGADRAYALVRDSLALRVLRQPLVRAGDDPQQKVRQVR